MRSPRKTILLVLLLGVLSSATEPAKQSADMNARQMTLAEFDAETRRLESSIAGLTSDPEQTVALHQSIPDTYIVVGGNTSFLIDNRVLKKSVGEYRIAYPQRKGDLRKAMLSAVKQMREGLSWYSTVADHNVERGKLAEVMARKEFRRVAGPTAFDVWVEKAKLGMQRILEKILGNLPDPEKGSDILTWVLIAVATSLLAIWLLRTAMRAEVGHAREPVLFAPSGKHWRKWFAEAQAAAEGGNWREAIHLAYWAGISSLEESGAWVPDRARTPREYLRIISPRDPNRSALSELTKKFEVVWYGDRPAAAADYQETLQQLEVMGCR